MNLNISCFKHIINFDRVICVRQRLDRCLHLDIFVEVTDTSVSKLDAN